MIHLGSQIFETERLVLRPMRLEDAPSMFTNWASDDEVARYVTWETHKELQTVTELLEMWVGAYKESQDFYNWGIELKSSGQLIGNISFVGISERDQVAELGYCMGRQWWNQGYMTEAVKSILDFGFDHLGLKRIQSVFDVRNPASGRVMEKAGMIYEGTMREVREVKGQRVTTSLYAILPSDRYELKKPKE